MPANVVDRLLMATDEEKQAADQSIASISGRRRRKCNKHHIALSQEIVEDAIMKIRQVGLNRETIYTCYVTEEAFDRSCGY